ncbi:MAG: T9SS type A sorting domain-containing protein [Bacteroidota bacterium]
MKNFIQLMKLFRLKTGGIAICMILSGVQFSSAQIICIYCYEQNDSISLNVNNLLLNGGFENHNCIPMNWFSSSYCPNSAYYNCNISDWICTGGGSNTYADIVTTGYAKVVEGTYTCYFGNSYARACSSTQNDTSCLTSVDCTTGGMPIGYPNNDAGYGGALGLSIEQTVSGLTVGNSYILEFWAGGEASQTAPGLFAVDVGFGNTFLRNNHTPSVGGIGTRYLVEFNATSTSHTIKFTNWGHICSLCTELILDDVRLYTLAELSPVVQPCTGANIQALFSAPNNICPGTCTDFTNLSVNATSFLWFFQGANPSVSSDVAPTNICYNSTGSYDVMLIASNATTSDTLTLLNYITVYPSPPPQGIIQNGDTLTANQGAISYQWYHDGNIIPGATDYFYVASSGGDYNLVATDVNNCEVEAVIYDVIAGLSTALSKEVEFMVFPNPVVDKLIIQIPKAIRAKVKSVPTLEISIYNVLGEKVSDEKSGIKYLNSEIQGDVSKLQPGIYFVRLFCDEKSSNIKFVKL